MNIVQATLQDAQEIATVHVRSWQAAYRDILSAEFLDGLSIERRAAQWQDILKKQESQTLVARYSGSIDGFVSFGHWRDDLGREDQSEIWALYVSPEAWGAGIGRALLAAAIGELQTDGRHTVFLWVLSENHRGIRFYQKFGFQPVPGGSKLFQLGGREVGEVCLRWEPAA